MKNELQQFHAVAYAAGAHEKRGAGSIRVRVQGGTLDGLNVSCSRQARQAYRHGTRLLVTGRLVESRDCNAGDYVKATTVQVLQ
jgi:hypothetical protein